MTLSEDTDGCNIFDLQKWKKAWGWGGNIKGFFLRFASEMITCMPYIILIWVTKGF